MNKGIDYAWGGNTAPVSAFKQNGVDFVMRYVSHDKGNTATVVATSSKDITPSEVEKLIAAGIGVGLVFEDAANRALAGEAAGKADAQFAQARAHFLGLDDAVIYFATDFDATDQDKPKIAEYLKGAISVLGRSRVGVYGDYYVVKYMVDNNVIDWYWQTYAWSGGLVHPKAHILQFHNGANVGGLSVDLNNGLKSNIGVVFPKPKPKPQPVPKPVPSPIPDPVPAPKPDEIVVYQAWRNWRLIDGGVTAKRPSQVPVAIPPAWWGYLNQDAAFAETFTGADRTLIQKLQDKVKGAVSILTGN